MKLSTLTAFYLAAFLGAAGGNLYAAGSYPPPEEEESDVPPGMMEEIERQEAAEVPFPDYDYNEIHRVQPQFQLECVEECRPMQVPDPAGESVPAISYYCSSNDERDQYLTEIGQSNFSVIGGQSLHRFFRVIDNWRSSSWRNNRRQLHLGVPERSSNCHRFGNPAAIRFDEYLTIDDEPDRARTDLTSTIVNAFADRNHIDDGQNFRYGRYLFHFIVPSDFNVSRFGQVDREAPHGKAYTPNFVEPTFVECPYTAAHQAWGFRCAEMAADGAYLLPEERGILHFESVQNATASQTPMHPEQWNLYKNLLREAVDFIGYRIDRGDYGNLRPGASNYQREMGGVVLTIWEILDRMESRMASCDPITGNCIARLDSIPIFGWVGSVPPDTLVAVERRGGHHRVVIPASLGNDLQARRAANSHSNFNTVQANGETASYGIRIGGGLFEQPLGPYLGYFWSFNTETDQMFVFPDLAAARFTSHGFGAFVVPLIAHQLCHFHYRERDLPFVFGTPAAGAEEELCIQAQALVLDTLRRHGYVRTPSAMDSREYIPQNDVQTHVGRAFYFENAPRAHNNIFVGNYLENMYVINNCLRDQDHECARMAAHLTAMCPFFEEPEEACINGVCGANPFNIIVPGFGPPLEEEPQPVPQFQQPQFQAPQFQQPQFQQPGVSP